MPEETSELERKKERKLTNLLTTTTTPTTTDTTFPEHKVLVGIHIEPSLHRAVKFLAPYFETTISEQFSEAMTEHLETLIARLPETVQLNVIHQIAAKKELADPEITGLKIDIMHEQLEFWVKRLKAAPENILVKNNLQRQLAQTLAVAARSGNDDLKRSAKQARELLRGSLH